MNLRPHIPRSRRTLITLLLPAVAAACAGSDATGPRRLADAEMVLTANVTGTPIDKLVATISATDIATAIIYNMTVVNGVASATLKIPPGTARTIKVEAFVEPGLLSHEGSVTIDVQPGINPPVAVRMLPRSGQVPVTAYLTSFSVEVTPSLLQLGTGETGNLAASIIATDGTVLEGSVEWATANPGVAQVDANGVVTARNPGDAIVVAVFDGVAGAAAVQVVTAEVDGVYQGDVAMNVTGNVFADFAEEVVANGFGCTNPCAASGELTPTGNPDEYSYQLGAGTFAAVGTATLSGDDLSIGTVQHDAVFTIIGTGTLDCVSTGTPLTLDRFAVGGPSLTGPVVLDCTLSDSVLGSLGSGVVTLTFDLVRTGP